MKRTNVDAQFEATSKTAIPKLAKAPTTKHVFLCAFAFAYGLPRIRNASLSLASRLHITPLSLGFPTFRQVEGKEILHNKIQRMRRSVTPHHPTSRTEPMCKNHCKTQAFLSSSHRNGSKFPNRSFKHKITNPNTLHETYE